MIVVENVCIDDEIIQDKFVCALESCKGGCCVDGDAGAPLENDELEEIDAVFDVVKKYLSQQALDKIAQVGKYVKDGEYGMVTPDINGGICVYGYTDQSGVVKCAIEKAYLNGETTWKKPISCHLFPIIVEKQGVFDAMKYEPRETLCAPACANGVALGVPVYKFLQEPITRKFGAAFYDALEQVAVYKKSRK